MEGEAGKKATREDGDKLFHYTSSAGLFGILQSNCLWATHYRFLNDSREFFAARGLLTSILANSIAAGIAAEKANRGGSFAPGFDLKKRSQDEAERLMDIFYTVFGKEGDRIDPYVFSMFACVPGDVDYQNGGLLHWATYGRNGGYAIELNPELLQSQLGRESDKNKCGVISGPAIYDVNQNIGSDFRAMIEGIEKFGRKFAAFMTSGEAEKSQDIEAVLPDFLRLVAIIKDPYFKSERETRAVVYRATEVAEKYETYSVSVRLSGGTPIPYIKLLDGLLLAEECPIERIIIGPHSDNARREFALNTFLRSRKLHERIKVTVSNVPFVDTPF